VDNSGQALVRIVGLRKSFGETHAVRGVDLTLSAGEFVGLMGPNGAGKSTLIKVLSGVHDADEGTIELSGRSVRNLAGRPEVGFIHQDLGLVDEMSVLDNLRLGAKPLKLVGPVLHRGNEIKAAQDALAKVGLDLPVTINVGLLSPGEKALLAVARLLHQGARVLVVDETTSTLPPRESRWFVSTLKKATEDGTCVLMVSHKLSELLSVAERVVLLIDGVVVEDRIASPSDQSEIVQVLASHEEQVAETERAESIRPELGDPVLVMSAATTRSVGPIDLTVRAGQIVGLTGLVGSGLHQVGLLAHGAIRPDSGEVTRLDGARSGLVAPQRETQGGVADLPVLWNATLSALPRWRNPLRLLRLRSERDAAVGVLAGLKVKPSDPGAPMGSLSGGNQQKVLFARTLLQRPKLFVLCEPTRGVDVRTRHEIYRLIERLRDEGAAILVVTSDSEDLFAICDLVGVVSASGLSELWEPGDLSENQLAEVL
jgi:ribose transport system ATP-binding protein